MSDVASDTLSNGAGAATILSVSIGCFALGVLALAGDAMSQLAATLNFWKPTGALSGVTDLAIIIWLATWLVLSRLWSRRTVNFAVINGVSLALFVLGLLLTFPPFMDFLQGK